jgi:hypothetical protein
MSTSLEAPPLDYDTRRFDLMVRLRTLAGEAGVSDKNAYLRIGGKPTLETRLIQAVNEVDTLIKDLMQ